MRKQVLNTMNLTKKYKEFFALNNVSINVEKGDIYGLIGKNGAGKTSFQQNKAKINLILGVG